LLPTKRAAKAILDKPRLVVYKANHSKPLLELIDNPGVSDRNEWCLLETFLASTGVLPFIFTAAFQHLALCCVSRALRVQQPRYHPMHDKPPDSKRHQSRQMSLYCAEVTLYCVVYNIPVTVIAMTMFTVLFRVHPVHLIA